jgi:Zn-dependent protease with chaperone function
MVDRMSLESGLNAAQEGRYQEAIELLELFCRNCGDHNSHDYLTAQMWLVKAYQGHGQIEKAIIICQQLLLKENLQVRTWAAQMRENLSNTPAPQPLNQKENRAAMAGVKLAMGGVGGSLVLASGVTISLLFGMVLVLVLSLVFIIGSSNPLIGLAIAIGLTVVFNLAAFFLSPFLMDLTQRWLYQTRWVDLAEIETLSPETARVIRRVCQQKKLKSPRLGIIEDNNPTAFTYGSLPNSARLVVSRGLFTYLDDDEIATVYAHELGHIVHWDFAIMTVAATLVQICYLIYITARELRSGTSDDNKIKDAIQTAAVIAYIFYIIGTYLLLYLSRTREYFADHFAAETTGNPNGLSRALVKIAYGIVEEGSRIKQPSRLVEGTRALGIYDPKAAAATGTAYRIASDPQKIGRVFLWDMFNPWGWWMELNSTHPLTGKRVRALSTYAEQLGLPTEFDMGSVIAQGKHLSKSKLYGNFLLDIMLYGAETLGLFVGLGIGLILWSGSTTTVGLLLGAPLIGLGAGVVIKALIMFPNYSQAPETDILALMSDPYASPLRGQPAKLEGELIGRGDAGYVFGSDLKIQDSTGMLYLHYASRFGPVGNFLFGMKRVQSLIGC